MPVCSTEMQVAVPGTYRFDQKGSYAPVSMHLAPSSQSEGHSTRASAIDAQAKALDSKIEQLDATTRARNRDLSTHLNEIQARITKWETLLGQERTAQQHEHTASVVDFDDRLAKVSSEQEAVLMETMESFHGDLIPAEEANRDLLEHDANIFIRDTLPQVIDRQSGIVERKLRKARDTFDIENAKIAKRELKIVERFRTHAGRTAQAFEDERATRKSKFCLLTERLAATERMDDRNDERTAVAAVNAIAHLQARLQDECAEREREDNSLLDTMLFAQQALQSSVVKAFGPEAPENDRKMGSKATAALR